MLGASGLGDFGCMLLVLIGGDMCHCVFGSVEHPSLLRMMAITNCSDLCAASSSCWEQWSQRPPSGASGDRRGGIARPAGMYRLPAAHVNGEFLPLERLVHDTRESRADA